MTPDARRVADGLADKLREPLEEAIDAGVSEAALVVALVSQLYGMLAWRFGRNLAQTERIVAEATKMVLSVVRDEHLTPDPTRVQS